ncbi:MAG: hypothetical protein GXY62_01695 [Thermotogaceae bacterium]|nr:hypothetical protein [Thermotogaceae bacterium]HQN27754.1 hypothetical protein [Mesotoga sp.]HQQ55059.1 hypothetical protein [Mesotoga sp.]
MRIIKLRFVSILSMFVLLIPLVACSDRTGYSVSIKQARCEFAECYLDLDIRYPAKDRPEILITVDRIPVDAMDGVRTDDPKYSFKLESSGSHKIYVTLVKGKRFLTSPVSTDILVDTRIPETPSIIWRVSGGMLLIHLATQGNISYTAFKILVNSGIEKISTSPYFEIDIEKGRDYIIQGYTSRGVNQSEPGILDFLLNEDEAPKINTFIESPYSGGPIMLTLEDDWDRSSRLSVNAFAELSGIRFLYDGQRLIPESPLPQGEDAIVVKVMDSSGNCTEYWESFNIVKRTSESLPELYIEEGAVRNAKWAAQDGTTVLQKFGGGEWTTISTHDRDEKTTTIPRDSLSIEGDLYRLLVKSASEITLPSMPVFAKESFFKRFSTEVISSLLGMDALLVGENDYRLFGNIVVRENSIMKVESGSTLTIARGNTLLVSGVLDLEGRKDRIALNPGGSYGTLEVSNNGILIARNVDFNKTRIVVKNASVIAMDDCTLGAGLEIRGARTVQLYNCEIAGDILFDGVIDLYIHSSRTGSGKFVLSNSLSSTVSRSKIENDTVEIRNSRVSFLLGAVSSQNLKMHQLSRVSMTGLEISSEKLEVLEASSLSLEEIYSDGKFLLSARTLSRVSLNEELAGELELETDEKSVIATY